MIYLDNAATSFPRPPSVLRAMAGIYEEYGCSPGRGGYDAAVAVEERVSGVRKKLARLFGLDDPYHLIFGSNATDGLNMAILGLTRPGDHVVSTRLEHNSVLRPLHHLQRVGRIQYDLVPFDGQGFVDPRDVSAAITPSTRLCVINHASNVLGSIQDLGEIGRACREKGVLLLVDAAQSAGFSDLEMKVMNVDVLAFTGHKALLGPAGIGGLAVGPGADVRPARFGGTGVESDRLDQPEGFPYRLEAGTPNLPGIFGLGAGVDALAAEGTKKVRERELDLAQRLWDGLESIGRVVLYGARPDPHRTPVISCNVQAKPASAVGEILDGDFDIAVRTGLHCAPLVHQDLGTHPAGAVRFSMGFMNTRKDIDGAVEAMDRIARSGDG